VPTRALQLKIRRLDAHLFTDAALTGLAAPYGQVESVWASGSRAAVTFTTVSAAAALHAYLVGAKQCVGFGRARIFGSFADPGAAGAPRLTSAERIPSVTSDVAEAVSTAARTTPHLVGVTIVPGFITHGEETALLATVDRDDRWDTGPASTQASRRTQHFGYAYDYRIQGASADSPVQEPPPQVASLVRRMRSEIAEADKGFDQITLQEYTAGQGIPPHIDTVWAFGPVLASISLLSDCVMRFRPVFGVLDDPAAVTDLLLPRRSLLLLSGSARYHFSHAILARKHDVVDGNVVPRGRRLSLTFRSMLGRPPPP
jgi:alkylated DNA repair dioxygenase AlkB